MKEFVSIKVSSFDHAALATSLTTKAAEGWDVVSVVAVGNDIVAYLSREATKSATSSTAGSASSTSSVSSSTGSSEPAGWASAKTTDAASTPTQAMTAMSNTGSVAAPTSSDSSASSSTTPTVPADWYKDPSGRYEYRYWDGQKWTEHVSRAGTVYKDPPTP